MSAGDDGTDVLVVGAGPTGLVCASELLRRGVRVRIVDELGAPSPYSKALGVHARTLEIFEDFGVVDDLLARGIRVEGASMRAGDKPVIEVELGELDSRFNFILCVSQVETETVLRAMLEKRGGHIERGTKLVSLEEDASGVSATLKKAGGEEERVRASWVVGCDGAHSTVRHAVSATFEGHTYEETFVLADVRLDWDEPTNHITTYFAEDGVVMFFPVHADRWRIILTSAAPLGDAPTLDEVRAMVERRAGRAVPMRDAVWISPFRIHCRQVACYRHGRVFLAGDAAHVHSPVGGQGMNTGIQDAHNLAWKLALVVAGRGREVLLESYDAERHPIGRHVLDQTDFATKMGLLTGVLAPIRNQIARFVTSFEPVRRRIVRDAAELTVAYPSSPIVGEHTTSPLGARLARPEAGETPTLGSLAEFASGPRPGARAPDGKVTIASYGRASRLGEIWSGDAFTLLLFDGRSPSGDGYERLVGIARRMRDAWKGLVRAHVVTPRAGRPREIPDDVSVLLDSGELESRYGAKTECLYLVRPDLYVGFRSQPADARALDAHLATLLVEPR